MIEVLSYKPFQNSTKCLKGSINIRIPTEYGNLVIKHIQYFEKGSQRWFSFPQKEVMIQGKKNYYGHLFFEEKEYRELFQKDIMKAFEGYQAKIMQAAVEIKQINEEINDNGMPF
jgi:hypothetical protein